MHNNSGARHAFKSDCEGGGKEALRGGGRKTNFLFYSTPKIPLFPAFFNAKHSIGPWEVARMTLEWSSSRMFFFILRCRFSHFGSTWHSSLIQVQIVYRPNFRRLFPLLQPFCPLLNHFRTRNFVIFSKENPHNQMKPLPPASCT